MAVVHGATIRLTSATTTLAPGRPCDQGRWHHFEGDHRYFSPSVTLFYLTGPRRLYKAKFSRRFKWKTI
jgi:hypothetical protein